MIARAYTDGSIVLLVIAGIAAEALVLAILFHRTGRGVPPGILLPNLLAGVCLLGAAGLAMRAAWWGWTGALLLAAGLLHAIDLRGRWR